MNNLRILGQVLLWAGFLSAALAAVSRKEFDALPATEQQALLSLPAAASIPRSQLQELAGKPIRELTTGELGAVVEQLRPIVEQRLQFEAQVAEVAAKPLSDLSADELAELAELLPQLQAQAQAREQATREAETLNETEQATLRAGSRPVSREALIAERIFTIENRWQTVPWLWYTLSVAVGVVGVVCLRASSKSASRDFTRVEAEYTVIQTSLQQLDAAIDDLAAHLDTMRPRQVVEAIDAHCAEPFADFADARNALIQRFGLQTFADVMTDFSSAERFINRAWSAAADGYMQEVCSCVQVAQHHLKQARACLQQAEETSAGRDA